MLWLLQSNLNSSDVSRQISALDSIGADYSLVKLVPFFGILDPEPVIPPDGIIALGSTTMIEVAIKRGWKPGVFFNSNFSYLSWTAGYGAENLFNGNGRVVKMSELSISSPTFIRPNDDLKSFTGFVISPEELEEWKVRVSEMGRTDIQSQLSSETLVVAAPPKPIYREYRVFIVDGRAVSASLYRTINGIERSANVPNEIYEFAQQMADEWNPADAYVLDVAVGDDGPKVLEINCFNGAGSYEADLVKVYGAIQEMLKG